MTSDPGASKFGASEVVIFDSQTNVVPSIIGPSIWQPLIRASRLDEASIRILRYMHNRHVGVTPTLIASLMPWIEKTLFNAASPSADTVWRELVVEMQKALDGVQRQRPHRRFELYLGFFPAYAISQLAMPLIHRATQDIKRNILFGEDGHSESPPLKMDYKNYAIDLEKTTSQLLRSESLQLFIRAHALVLDGMYRRGLMANQGSTAPVADKIAQSLLLRLVPTDNESWRRDQQKMAKRQASERSGRRPQQGGVVGITHSNSLGDIANMLQTEHMLPKFLRFDRLLHEGFYIRDRPPMRQKKKDALVVGLMPAFPAYSLLGKLARTIWVEAVSRFSKVMVENNMMKCSFLWLEHDAVAGLKCHVAHLSDWPATMGVGRAIPLEAFRRHFLKQLSWLPGFANRSVTPNALVKFSAHDVAKWSSDTFKHNLHCLQRAEDQDEPVSLKDYRMIEIMLVAPKFDDEPEKQLRLLIEYMATTVDAGHRYDLLSLPREFSDLKSWQVCSADIGVRTEEIPVERPVEIAEKEPGYINNMAGALAEYWEQRLVEGVFGE